MLKNPDFTDAKKYVPKRKQFTEESSSDDGDITSDDSNFVPDFEIPPEKYLEPDSPTSVCHSHNNKLFDSMTVLNSEPEEKDEEVIVHKLNHDVPMMQAPPVEEENDPYLGSKEESSYLSSFDPEHVDSSTLDFITFQPLFITFGQLVPGVLHVPCYIQYAYYPSKFSI